MSRRTKGTVAVLAAALALSAVTVLVVSAVVDDREPETIEVVVARGAGDIRTGGADELLPRRLEVEVGDTLVIDNRDDQAHTVGPYTVAAGQRLEHRFTREGVIEGECTLHPSGRVTIVVG